MLKNVVITVAESQISKLPAVSRRLRQRGLQVDSVLPFGVITGQIEESQIDNLRRERDVNSVNLDREARMA